MVLRARASRSSVAQVFCPDGFKAKRMRTCCLYPPSIPLESFGCQLVEMGRAWAGAETWQTFCPTGARENAASDCHLPRRIHFRGQRGAFGDAARVLSPQLSLQLARVWVVDGAKNAANLVVIGFTSGHRGLGSRASSCCLEAFVRQLKLLSECKSSAHERLWSGRCLVTQVPRDYTKVEPRRLWGALCFKLVLGCSGPILGADSCRGS